MRKLFLYILIYFLWALYFSQAVQSESSYYFTNENYSIHRQIQYSFTLQNRSNSLLEKAEFWTYAPVKQTATQRTVRLEASHPYELIEDVLGNQILYFELKNLPPYSTKILTIKANLELSDTPNPLSVQDIDSFLKAEKFIESDDPEISIFARKFIDLNQVKTAENIYRWVSDNIKYIGYLSDSRGALYAFKNRNGDCTEFMSLYVAFSRANNIPARGIGGYVVRENSILKPYDYHNWAEFYDEETWRIADPQKEVFMDNQSHYIAMRIIEESSNNPMGEFNRFRYSGDGLQVKMN